MDKIKIFLVLFLLQVSVLGMSQNGMSPTVNQAVKVLKGMESSMSKQEAVKLLTTAAVNDSNAYAMNILGMAYLQGLGVEKNTEKTVCWWKQAVANGYNYAYHNLGMLYKNGKYGVTQDFAKACSYFIKGADANSLVCCYDYAFMLYKGLGCQQSYESAISYFLKAANKKHSPSLYMLGLCYRNGYGVKQDEDMARYYLTQAANLGYTDAKKELQRLHPENIMLEETGKNDVIVPLSMPNTSSNLITEDLVGKYEGFLVLYDWSGKYILGEKPIQLDMKLNDGKLKGVLLLDGQSIQLQASVREDGKLMFEDNSLVLKERYVGETGCNYRIDYAELNTFGDVINGRLGVYSMELNEPERPIYMELRKPNASVGVSKELGMMVSPNPFDSDFTVSFILTSDCSKIDVCIFNQSGSLVDRQTYASMQKGNQTIRITPSITSGLYVLSVNAGNQMYRTLIRKK